jgi:hypothetical protein
VRRALATLGLVCLVTTGLGVARAEDAPKGPVPDKLDPHAEVPADAEKYAQWGRGPLEVADPFILAELRSAWYARSPRIAKHLELEVGLRAVWENSYGWLDDDTLRLPGSTNQFVHRATLDAETRTFDLVARFGILDRVELGVDFRAAHWRGGGVMDGMVRQFHRSFGIGSLDREQRPNDAYLVAGVEPDGSAFNLKGRGTRGPGDTTLSARVLAFEGSDYLPAVTLGARVWLPTAQQGLDHADGLAETLTIDLSKRLGDLPLILYAGGAYSYYDDCRIQGLQLTRNRGAYYVGIEWEIYSRLSFVVHFFQETPRERQLWRRGQLTYGNYVMYVAAGFKFEPIDGLTLEFGFLENGIDPNTSGDVGFLFNLWWRWGVAGAADGK